MNPEELSFTLKVAASNDDPGLLRSLQTSVHPATFARALPELEIPSIARLLRRLRPDRRGVVFGYLEPHLQDQVANHLEDMDLSELLACMPADERVDVWSRLPEARQSTVLQALDKVDRAALEELANYPEGTVGALMTPTVVALPADLSVARALPRVRAQARKAEDVYVLYILDPDRKLVGTLALRQLLLATEDQTLGDICDQHPIVLRPRDPWGEAARVIRDFDLVAVPVVDHDGKLLGAVTHDDATDVQDLREAIQLLRIGGVTPAGPGLSTSLLRAPLSLLYRKRITWLIVLVVANVFSGAGIMAFEDLIASNAVLVVFLPLLIDSGGNAGSQAATLTIRSLATGDVQLRDWARLLGREAAVGAMLGASMALVVSLLGLIRGGPELALIVAVSMTACVLAGSLIGAVLPFALQRLRFDPATASAPLVTSMCDALGVVIYFSVSSWLLGSLAGATLFGWTL